MKRTEALMGTIVSMEAPDDAAAAIERAFGWFQEIEVRCTRFQEDSELRRLVARPGEEVAVSAILFETLQFAMGVAEETGGAFDCVSNGSWRDIELQPSRSTVRLRRSVALDLGAVAKGLAVDLAAKELAPFRDFAIDAGGDLYLGGRNSRGAAWRVGIPHPRNEGELMAFVEVSDAAVCTSGDYERGDHILDPRTGVPATQVASTTVIAAGAMLADALGTAAFVMGPCEGIAMLERLGVEGLIVTPDLEQFATRRFPRAA